MRNIAKKRIVTEEILEKKKQEKESNRVTKKANLNISMSSIFLPNQIKKKLLNKVAEAYIEPNCPWVIDNSFLILELNNPKKKLCPKLEKNVNINPKIITFLLKESLIIYELQSFFHRFGCNGVPYGWLYIKSWAQCNCI